MKTKGTPQVLVLGGGFGGLESALSLKMRLQGAADVTLLSDSEYFQFKPNTIYIPFGLDPAKLRFRLAGPTRRKNIHFVQARAKEIDPIARKVHVAGGDYHYDYLVVATGAEMRLTEIPGMSEFACTAWNTEGMLTLRERFNELAAAAKRGERKSVLFLVAPNNRCTGPLYEMILMLDTWLRRKHVRDSVSISCATYEEAYIQTFGPRLHEVVNNEFSTRRITGYTTHVARHIEEREVVFGGGERLPFDLLIAFPPTQAATEFHHLPVDRRGFIGTDLTSRQVIGYPDVYAVGDAGDFPVKQAHLAFLQADAAADHLSAQILGVAPQIDFDPVSLSVMESVDRGTFAQVPLRLTGDPEDPVEVRYDEESYKVGSSPIWKLGKMALGIYLPWRFKAGNPFHAGLPWKGMEAGLKLMSGLLAK